MTTANQSFKSFFTYDNLFASSDAEPLRFLERRSFQLSTLSYNVSNMNATHLRALAIAIPTLIFILFVVTVVTRGTAVNPSDAFNFPLVAVTCLLLRDDDGGDDGGHLGCIVDAGAMPPTKYSRSNTARTMNLLSQSTNDGGRQANFVRPRRYLDRNSCTGGKDHLDQCCHPAARDRLAV